MFAMARLVSSPSRRTTRIIFCILVVCLAVHFLIEDALLPNAYSSIAMQNAPSYEEASHQDDLVLPVQPLDCTQNSTTAPIPAGFPLSEAPVGFPILIPPKI